MQQNFKSDNQRLAGKTTYSNNIVAPIIALAAKEISGVASLQGNGVRTHFVGNTVNVDLFINIFTGYSCPDVAFRAQENIKRMVETMSKFKVGIVNVFVLGVTFTAEEETSN